VPLLPLLLPVVRVPLLVQRARGNEERREESRIWERGAQGQRSEMSAWTAKTGGYDMGRHHPTSSCLSFFASPQQALLR
jgi:hypothetical protein